MSFWSGEKLLERGKEVFHDSFDPSQIDCNSYKLCVGDQYFQTESHEKNSNNSPKIKLLSDKESFYISPGQFAFLISKESVTIPDDTMAFISMRTPIKLRGLINVSGFNVDPGYSGQLVYAVYNASPSPVYLKEGEPAFKIWLCAIDQKSESKYLFDQRKSLHEISNDLVHSVNRDVLSIQGLADRIDAQERDIERRFAEQKPVIDNLMQAWRTIVMGVIVSLLIAIFSIALTFVLPITWKAGKTFSSIVISHINSYTKNK